MVDYVNAFSDEEIIIEACTYKERASATVVINTKTLPDYMYIHLPVECTHLDMIKMTEITNQSDESSEDAEAFRKDDIIKYPDHPWARINSKVFNWLPGKHMYKLSFTVPSILSKNVTNYYISYISQEDNPEKDYVYMRR